MHEVPARAEPGRRFPRNVGDPLNVYQAYPSTYGQGGNFGYKTFGYTAAETHTFSPYVVNDLRIAWFDHPSIRQGINLDFDPTTLFPQLTKSTNRGLPTMLISGYTGMFYDYGQGYYGHGADAELSEILMRAFILRRAELLAQGIGDVGGCPVWAAAPAIPSNSTVIKTHATSRNRLIIACPGWPRPRPSR